MRLELRCPHDPETGGDEDPGPGCRERFLVGSALLLSPLIRIHHVPRVIRSGFCRGLTKSSLFRRSVRLLAGFLEPCRSLHVINLIRV